MRLVRPGVEGYEARRAVWNAMVDRRPAMIALCENADDVAEAVRLARSSGLEVGVRCGGHSVLGLPVCEGGLMLDLTPMGEVRVDPGRRRAWVQGGAMLGALDRATQEFGLATTAGNVSHTGVGGLTLGGGMGWLARQYGLSCDNVESYELVTADGEKLRASESENPELFWGLRGGGGNFGVVTEFEFRLHETGTRALLVELSYEQDRAMPAFRRWRDLLAEAPRRATFTALAADPLVNVGYVWVGDPEEGRRLLPGLREAATPVIERVEELSYLELQTMDDSKQGHRFRRYWKGHYLTELGDEAIQAFLSRRDGDPAATLQAYGGAIADVAAEASAFSQRDALVEFVAAARWTDPAEDEQRMAASRRYAAGLDAFSSGAYVNVLSDDAVGRAYRKDKLERLTLLKDRYDPENVFHLNQNIKPTA